MPIPETSGAEVIKDLDPCMMNHFDVARMLEDIGV